MSTKSRETIFGPSVRASAERAAAARKEADRLACEAWNKRMLGYRGPAQLSPTSRCRTTIYCFGSGINVALACLDLDQPVRP